MILQILDEITAAKGSKKKVAVLQSYSGNFALKEIWQFAYTRVNFGTSVMIPLEVGNSSIERNFGKIVWLLDQLRCKTVTGNNAKNFITKTLSEVHPDCIEVYNRIIKGNLKCGVGFTAGQKVYGKSLFKKYPVMLISPHCNKKAAKIVASGAVMQLKGDGVRGISECHDNNDVKYFSRQGEVYIGLDKFDRQIRDLKQFIRDSVGTSARIDFDGEFCVIEDGVHHPSKASGIMNKCIDGTATEEDIDQLTYMVWDIIDSDLVDEDLYEARLATLEEAINYVEPADVILAETWKVENLDEVHAKYAEIVKTGNEGVVLKSLKNLWKDTRVTDCIKYKEKHRAEFKIVSWYYGEAGKEFQNVLGGYHVESACGLVTSKTGSGLSFEDRGILMDITGKKPKPLKDENGNYILDPDFNFEEWIDGIVSIEYNRRTKSKNVLRETYSLRFPIIKQFRKDKTDANTMEEMITEEGASYGLRV